MLRARRGHADGVSGGAFTREQAPCFSRRDHAVDGARWGTWPRPHRQVVRGRRRPQNLVRRDTEVCPSPSVTCRCHTPAPSPVPRPTTKSSSVDCTGENFRDRTPPRTVNTRRPAGTDHPRRADTATPAQRRMPHRHTPTRRPRKAGRTPTGEGPTGRVVGVVSSRPAVRPPTAAAPTGRIVGVTAAAKLADCLASVTTDGTQPVRLFVRRHGHSPRHALG